MAPSSPTGPAPSTTARCGFAENSHGSRLCTFTVSSSAFSAIVSGSTNTPTPRIAAGTAFRYRSSSTTRSVMKPCIFMIPRSVYSPVMQKSGRSARHATHPGAEHGRRTIGIARSPGRKSVTAAPTSTTSANAS